MTEKIELWINMPTLVTQIIAHVRKRFFGKKFTLCGLKLDLCILIKLVGKKILKIQDGMMKNAIKSGIIKFSVKLKQN